MLTIEMLSQNPLLSGLTDAQRQAIADMSKNDENTVIGTKIGELHGHYDADVLGVTGIAKNDGEKSYDYVKRILGEYKTKIEASKTIKTQLDAANAKVTDLEAKLAANAGNETLTQQLKDAKNQVTQLQAQLAAKDAELTSKKSEYEKSVRDIHIDYAFQSAVSGIKFKAGITEPVQKVLLSSAKAEILAKGTPDFIEENGKKVLVLRDANGNILNNIKNNLNPYTVAELVMETSLKDVIETRVEQTGGGTGGNGGNGGNGGGSGAGTLDMSNVKTQLEADKAIEAHLLASGLTRDSAEFAEQAMALRTENNVANLPIR